MPPDIVPTKLADRVLAKVAARLSSASRRVNNEQILRATGAKDLYLNGELKITHPDRVTMGENILIGANSRFQTEGGLTIGNNTQISRNCVIYTSNHNYKGERLPIDDTALLRPVVIGDGVWIGMNVCIAPGATIGDGAIIGLGSVVVGDVPPLAIYGARPAVQISERDPEHYARLVEASAYSGPGGRPPEK